MQQIIFDLAQIMADQVEHDPEFARRVAAVLYGEDGDAAPARVPRQRRLPAVLDPVMLIREEGEAALRRRLVALTISQLKDIMAEYAMDPGQSVMRSKALDRIVNHIIDVSAARAKKGDAFRVRL